MDGRIIDKESGEALIGANFVAVHLPTGSTYGNSTNLDGIFRIANMRVGGPYTITVSYTGFSDLVLEDIYLRLGENKNLNLEMQESAMELSTVTVFAAAGTPGANSGSSTQITGEEIDVMPTLNRNLSDYVRLTPQSAGYSGGTTFAGVNNRYNAIYIDGAVNNDVFGLASSGTNGGQTGIAPFSIDIIDQFQVLLSPYDVSLGGFAGGGINAVTKSGTNQLKATAYYFMQNQSLVGKTNKTLTDITGSERTPVAEFNQRTYGASLGGPLIKDKVFFFANAEIRQDETPIPFDFATYDGNASEADLNSLAGFLRESYGYDPGTFGDVADELNGLSLFGKLDFNLGDNHRLTLRHNYNKGEQLDLNGSAARTINFSNNGIFFPTITNTSAAEFNSSFGSGFSNNLILGYTTVRDDRDPIGGDFPYLIIFDGAGTIRAGSDEFSTANALDQDIFTITDNFKIYKNKHTITIGTHNEFYSIYNLFLPQNYGTYTFDSISAFVNGLPASNYDRGYSLVDDITGDGSAAAADFGAMQLGLYAQDEWDITRNFTLTYGLRLDMPILTTDPDIHPSFNTTTLPLLQSQYDIANDIEGGAAPDGQLMFSPRAGFLFDLTGDRRNMLRGGVGIFTSRIPFVWPGAMYNNNGLTTGRADEADAVGGAFFIPDINKQYTDPAFKVPSGDINIFTKDFKFPQVLRGNLALDTKLPGDISATVEGIFTKTLNNVLYTNVNSKTDVDFNWTNTGSDDRPVFTRSTIDPTYSAIYVGSNTSEGYAYTLTAALAKEFQFGLNASLAYTFGDAQALNEGTSSQNSSQWRGQVNTDGRNTPLLGRSDFALGHRVLSSLSYSFDWNKGKNVSTSIALLYDGMAGSPYSYVIGGGNGRNINNEQGSTSANRSLVWIPADASQINLVEKDGVTPEHQWEHLDAFIENDPYLSQNRGSYAEKNSNWMPFASFLDLAVRQDFGIKAGGRMHKLQVSLDVFNLANLINPAWGVRYSIPGDFNNYFLYTFEGYEEDGTTPLFSYLEEGVGKDALNINDFSSRWRMRLGLRYIFD
ncbi:MAG: TonB-dependent receptor [Saprospirales bacterium]|nr:TonB-dependent receptor [Saprospirales bacterium]